jgi:hypothetical protein
MPRRTQNLTLILALAAITLLAFTTTIELLPHHHDNINERVCPVCHPPLMGLQPAALKLPSLSLRSWSVGISVYRSIPPSPIRDASPRGPPAA